MSKDRLKMSLVFMKLPFSSCNDVRCSGGNLCDRNDKPYSVSLARHGRATQADNDTRAMIMFAILAVFMS